jgi:hypothetical protein
MRKLPLRLLQLVTILSACFKSFDLSLRSRRKHEAWGVSPRRAVVKDPKPTKWATAVCRPFHGLDGAPNLTQGSAFGYTLGSMLAPAPRALEKRF